MPSAFANLRVIARLGEVCFPFSRVDRYAGDTPAFSASLFKDKLCSVLNTLNAFAYTCAFIPFHTFTFLLRVAEKYR